MRGRGTSYEVRDKGKVAKYLWDLSNSLLECGPKVLSIRSEEREIVPFVMSRTQRVLHEAVEKQRRETGKVRMLVLKSRQGGGSTYVVCRFYHKAMFNSNHQVFTLANEETVLNNMKAMLKTLQEYNVLRGAMGLDYREDNKQTGLQLGNGSWFRFFTAGNKETGRGFTTTLFHGTEVARWDNAGEHFAGAVQTISPGTGTEAILETTANGPRGKFYEMWQAAEAGGTEWRTCFLPWYLLEKYRSGHFPDGTPALEGELSEVMDDRGESEKGVAERFGLTMEQMAWRRGKISEIGEARFRSEYPTTPDEAFEGSGVVGLIPGHAIARAERATHIPTGPVIMGVDPSGAIGRDLFSICVRQGQKVRALKGRKSISTPQEALSWMAGVSKEYEVDAIFMDVGGMGQTLYGMLPLEHPDCYSKTTPVNFSNRSWARQMYPDRAGPKNKRAQMWAMMRDWLVSEEGADIPRDTKLSEDLLSAKVKETADGSFILESKGVSHARSPDYGDALALTFVPVHVPTKRQRLIEKARVYRDNGQGCGMNSWMG